MKQFLIFVCGVLSMIIALSGMICAIQAIATGIPIFIVCALVFAVAWVYIVFDWFREKWPEEVADMIYSKFKK